MSEVETNATPVPAVPAVPAAPTTAPVAVPAAPAKPLTAIEHIEAEVVNFIKQREVAAKNAEKAIANVHAIDGAIQAAQFLAAKLKNEAAKAEAEVKKLYGEAKVEAATVIAAIEAEAKKL